MIFFFVNECLSLNGALAYLEWLLVLQSLRGERPKPKVTPEVKKFFVNYKFFFGIALRTVILKNCQLREVPPFPRACHKLWNEVEQQKVGINAVFTRQQAQHEVEEESSAEVTNKSKSIPLSEILGDAYDFPQTNLSVKQLLPEWPSNLPALA